MKTFKQFYQEAYQLNELDLRSMGRSAVNVVRGGVQQAIQNPRKAVVGGLKTIFDPKVIGKGAITRVVKEPIKRATGNNPILNKAIDVGADYIAPVARWGPALRTAAGGASVAIPGAIVYNKVIKPAAMRTGSYKNEAELKSQAFLYNRYGQVPKPPGTYPSGGVPEPVPTKPLTPEQKRIKLNQMRSGTSLD